MRSSTEPLGGRTKSHPWACAVAVETSEFWCLGNFSPLDLGMERAALIALRRPMPNGYFKDMGRRHQESHGHIRLHHLW